MKKSFESGFQDNLLAEASAPTPEKKVFELTDVEIEKIMEKCLDINKEGTAFSVIDSWPDRDKYDTIKSIFREGILGGRRSKGSFNGNSKESWAKDVRSGRQRNVFFNIVGRFKGSSRRHPAKEPVSEMAKSLYFQNHFHNDGDPIDGVAIVFDLKRMKEINGADALRKYEYKLQKDFDWTKMYLEREEEVGQADSGTKAQLDKIDSELSKIEAGHYGSDAELRARELIPGRRAFEADPRGKDDWSPESEYGFIGPVRIPPKLFEGIVFSVVEWEGNTATYSKDRKKWQNRAKALANAQMKIDKEKPENLVPIYDIQGNLYWPKKMTYEEVQKYLAGKDLGESAP